MEGVTEAAIGGRCGGTRGFGTSQGSSGAGSAGLHHTRRRPVSGPSRMQRAGLAEVDRCGESHNAPVATVVRLHQPLHQLSLLEHGAVVQTQRLHAEPQGAPRVAVQQVGPVLLVHGHHLTLHTLGARHRLPEPPGAAVGVAMETEGAGRGLAQLTEAPCAVDVVGVGRDQQAARLELNAVAGAQRKGGPL